MTEKELNKIVEGMPISQKHYYPCHYPWDMERSKTFIESFSRVCVDYEGVFNWMGRDVYSPYWIESEKHWTDPTEEHPLKDLTPDMVNRHKIDGRICLPPYIWASLDDCANPELSKKQCEQWVEEIINNTSKGEFGLSCHIQKILNMFEQYFWAVERSTQDKAQILLTDRETLGTYLIAYSIVSGMYKRTLFGLMSEGVNLLQYQKKLHIGNLGSIATDITKDEVLAYYQNETLTEAFFKEVQKVLRDNTQKQKQWFDRGYYGNAREVYTEAERRGWLTIVDDYKMKWHKPQTWLAYLILQIYSPEGEVKQRIENSFVEAVFGIKRLDAIIANRRNLNPFRDRAWEAEINALAMVGRKSKLIL